MPRFDAAGVSLFALSYDEPDALAAFASVHDITYPLLSDPDSEVIRRFGILNTLIAADDHPWYGLPFPGTYVIDADGVIVAKYFENNLALRPGADILLRAATGDVAALPPRTEPIEEVQVSVRLEGEDMPAALQRDLIATFAVPEGQHLYGEPVPEGMVAACISVDEDTAIVTTGSHHPPTQPMTQATGETLHVYPGDLELRLTVAHKGSIVSTRKKGPVEITGSVRWQSCNRDQCNLPQTQRFSLTVPSAPVMWMGRSRNGKVEEDTQKQFARLVDRRKPAR